MTSRGRAHVGCSGWTYEHWRGSVYPPDLPEPRWFEHYGSLFDSVELPDEAGTEGWAEQAPPGFVFAHRLGQFGSDAAVWLPAHVARLEGLGDHAGPTLVQLPPGWRRDVARLDEFLTVAPKTYRWAVELGDPSWLHEETYEVLRAHGAALCIHDLVWDLPWEQTTDWSYWRFHGPYARHQVSHGRYGPDGLFWPVERMTYWLGRGCDVYAYFNNDDAAHAVEDARWLADRLRHG